MESYTTKPMHQQAIFTYGIISLIISFLIFLLPEFSLLPETTEGMGLFMIHYAILLFYFFFTLFSGKLKKGKGGLPLVIITLLLFLISAYALNREMDVFEESIGWLQILLIVTSINLLVASLNIKIPFPIKLLQVCILTLGALLYLYLALYLLPTYAMGLLGTIAIGIGLHVFVPLLLLIYTITILVNECNRNRSLSYDVMMVACISVIIIGLYCYRWTSVKKTLEMTYHSATVADKVGWPAWVETLQVLPEGTMVDKFLKTDIVYNVADWNEGFNFFSSPRMRWEEPQKHDPLVLMASLFAGKTSIPREDRIRMLQTLHDNRYGAEERLWSGNNLKTVHFNTEVQIWPTMHIAYVEKTISVAQRPSHYNWRGNQQEAIYVFQLPEGAVVTSLSLWIEGKEEKSVLTTKGKASKAYKTIVGVEARDPSVVHWQEGNRVSVRIFPVLPDNQRIFKLGVTVPMPERDGKIWFENFTFIGPDAKQASESVKIRIMDSKTEFIHTVALKRQQQNLYVYQGKYNPKLCLALDASPVQPHTFSFEEKSYRLANYTAQKQTKKFKTFYADVNAGWTEKEWQNLLKHTNGQKLKVYEDGWIKIDSENQKEVFSRLSKRKITLFPFYAINDNQNSLVITKSSGRTPTLNDLRESTAFDSLVQCANQGKRFYLYHIGNEPSLYLSSLRELRLFYYAQGSLEDVMNDISQNQFDSDGETNNRIVLHNAGLSIETFDEPSTSNAPDHLLRLFAYNHIMQQGGVKLLADSSLEGSPFGDIASYAHIVTPVSSMIVLEKSEDYDRFDIDKNKEGLKNASTQHSGSVPEPHEWALMMVCLILLTSLYQNHKIKLLWSKK